MFAKKLFFTMGSMLSRVRTTDARLYAETLPKNPEMLGRAWDGFIKQLDQLSGTDRTLAIFDAQEELRELAQGHRGAMGSGPAASFSTAPRGPVSVQDMQRMNREFWAAGGKHSVTRDVAARRRGGPFTAADYQRNIERARASGVWG